MGRHLAAAVTATILSVCTASFGQGPPVPPPAQPGGAGVPGGPGRPGGMGPGGPPNGAGRPGGVVMPAVPNGAEMPGGPGFSQQQRPERSVRPTRERWREMSPEDRQRFRSNAERWQQMNAEERRALREREEWRQQRLKREAEDALRQSGLQLEAERRAIYERRYIEERRRVEQALRQELREKRQRELAPVVERLKTEFSQPQRSASPGSNTPSVSPSPN